MDMEVQDLSEHLKIMYFCFFQFYVLSDVSRVLVLQSFWTWMDYNL